MSSEASSSVLGMPREVVLHATSGALELVWEGGVRARLGPATLRAACRCAECERERRAGRPVPRATGATADVSLTGLEPVGDSGLQLRFSDGHERGIFPWSYLERLSDPQG